MLEKCEECSSQKILYKAIVDGKAKKLCRNCLITSNAIEIKKPKKIDIQTGRPSVKEILMKMSGLDKNKEKQPNLKTGISSSQSKEITLNSLIERKIQREKQAKERAETEITEITKITENKQDNLEIQIKKNPGENKEETKEETQLEEKENKNIKFIEPTDPFNFNIHTTKKIRIGDLIKFRRKREEKF